MTRWISRYKTRLSCEASNQSNRRAGYGEEDEQPIMKKQ